MRKKDKAYGGKNINLSTSCVIEYLHYCEGGLPS